LKGHSEQLYMRRGLFEHKPRSFLQILLQKCGRVTIFGLRFLSRIFEEFQHPAIQTEIVQHISGFFHQIKVRQPIGTKDSLQTVIRTSRRMDSFLYEAAQKFEVFSNIQNENQTIKNLPIAFDDYFKAYSMMPLSCRSNLAGR
jgi:hypothetical protein